MHKKPAFQARAPSCPANGKRHRLDDQDAILFCTSVDIAKTNKKTASDQIQGHVRKNVSTVEIRSLSVLLRAPLTGRLFAVPFLSVP